MTGILDAEEELSALMSRKKEVDRSLAALETQIFALEGTYLEETAQYGNCVRGFEGYLTAGAAGNRTERKKGLIMDQDRIFSHSSTTYLKVKKKYKSYKK